MKKNLFIYLLTVLCAVNLFTACSDDDDDKDAPQGDLNAPKITWAENPNFDTTEIKENMSAVINIDVENGLKSLQLDIKSAALTNEMLAVVGLSTSVDLVTVELTEDQASIIAGIPFGEKIKDATSLKFDISKLVPMIMILPNAAGNHTFSITVTDNKGKSAKKDLVFHYILPLGAAKLSEVNTWNNTAKVSVDNVRETTTVQYRRQGETDWQEATRQEDNTFLISTKWTESQNSAGLKIWTPDVKTGIWAAQTYEIAVLDAGQEVSKATFETNKGDAIPNGDMSGWSKKIWKDSQNKEYEITYPNAKGAEGFWDSGNNTFVEQTMTPLCKEEVEGNGIAFLSAQKVLGAIFAAGNLFSGDFNFSGFSGTVNFGKKYTWTARPRALKVRLKAEVGTIDNVGGSDPEKDNLKGKQDKIVLFAAITDWTKQHGVTSGFGTPKGMWHPETQNSVEEGAIIGYASKFITENITEYTTIEIPFNWYNSTDKPSTDNFSLVISGATSYRGDYLTGCSTNKLYIDSVEWVY